MCKPGVRKYSFCLFAAVCAVAAVLAGCDGGHHSVRVMLDPEFGASGSLFIIRGAAFGADAVVTFDGVDVATVVVSGRRILGMVPDLGPGIVDVLVFNRTTGSAWGPFEFAVVLPAGAGDVEGYAYFPYEDEWGNYPVYYDTGNELILVTFYDADDIYYEYPLRDFLTDTTGFYEFLEVLPDWYFLTAEAVEYDPVLDITDYYWGETPDFDLRTDELHIWDVYLEYDGSEPGYPRNAALLKKLGERGPGELDREPELETFHRLRLERFRQRLFRKRPAVLEVRTESEQLQPAAESN